MVEVKSVSFDLRTNGYAFDVCRKTPERHSQPINEIDSKTVAVSLHFCS